jgi:hypothetical protein
LGGFRWSLLWLLSVSLVVIASGSLLIGISWSLAGRKKFHYDYEGRVATWVNDGEVRSYSLSEWQREAEARSAEDRVRP